ncbi:MAG: sugar transferase [Armatimonadetes bacterium]|nr:sugar transferase [Armatimonadota bacterium]
MPAVTRAVVVASLTVSAVCLSLLLITSPLPSSRDALLLLPVLMVALTVAARWIAHAAFRQPIFHRRALLLGGGRAQEEVAALLVRAGGGTFRVLGRVDASTGAADERDDGEEYAYPLLGSPDALAEIIERLRLNAILVYGGWPIDGQLLATLSEARAQGVEIQFAEAIFEDLTGRVFVARVGGRWRVAMPIEPSSFRGLYPLAKRALDLVASTLGLCGLALLAPWIALAIRLDSPGPVLYSQLRVGHRGRFFRTYKFRSMRDAAEPEGAVWAEINDPRITRVGRFLRRSHIDELPQLWNVLRGEMSVVGPRPERPEFVARLSRECPFFRVRHIVRPGMAGWALVRQGYGASREDSLLKLQLDLYYIKNQSLWFDLVILLKTVFDAILMRGR